MLSKCEELQHILRRVNKKREGSYPYLAKSRGEGSCEEWMENDNGFIQVPYKHTLQWKNRDVILTSRRFLCMCEAKKEKYCRETFSSLCECVLTSISESRGGAGSLTFFLPLSFPSDPLRAGMPSSLPGVGGLGGRWYSPNTPPQNKVLNQFLSSWHFTD